MKGIFGAMNERRANPQEQLNGVKFIYSHGDKKIYGGTISSKVYSNIMLSNGKKVKIMAYGSVNLGMMAGTGSPDGIYGFQSYCMDPALPHGSLMVKTGSKWSLAGSGRTFVAPSDGVLQFAINDTDYQNNQGYFDFVVTVE